MSAIPVEIVLGSVRLGGVLCERLPLAFVETWREEIERWATDLSDPDEWRFPLRRPIPQIRYAPADLYAQVITLRRSTTMLGDAIRVEPRTLEDERIIRAGYAESAT